MTAAPFRAPALLALLLAATLSPALAAGPASPLASVVATVEAGRVVVDAKGASEGSVTLLVTHVDPLQGEVVDRVVTLNLTTNASLRTTIADARFDANLTVRVLDGAPDLPTLPDVGGLLDQVAIAELPDLLRLELPPIPVSARSSSVRVPVYPQGADIYASEEARLFATPQGHVALTRIENGTLLLASSSDGGRTFSPFIPILARPAGTDWIAWYEAAAAPDGRIVLLVQSRDVRDDWIHGTGWRVVTVDPAGPRIVSDVGLGASQGLRFDIHQEHLLPTRDGLLFAFMGTVRNGTQDFEPIGFGGADFQVWSISPDGIVRMRGSIATETYLRSSRVVASPSGEHIAVVGATSERAGELEASRIVVARSTDGGRTFSTAKELGGLPTDKPWTLDMATAAIDDLGTVHAVVRGWPSRSSDGGVWFDAWYLRAPLVGAGTTRALAPTVPAEHMAGMNVSIGKSHLALAGPRVTLLYDGSTAVYASESFDGGLTWSSAVRLEGPRGLHRVDIVYNDAMGLLPDGRIVFAGYAGDARYPPVLATILPFDPLPLGPQELVRLATPPAPDAVAPPPALVIEGWGEGNVPAGGNVSFYLYVKNEGTEEMRGDVVVTGLPPGIEWVSGIARFVLAPGETGGFGLLFWDAGAEPTDARPTLVLRDEGRDVSRPFPLHLMIAGSGAPDPVQEETPNAPQRETPPQESAPSPEREAETPSLAETPAVGPPAGAVVLSIGTPADAPLLRPGTTTETTVRVRNDGSSPARVSVHVDALPHVTVTTEPMSLDLQPGESREVRVRLTADAQASAGSHATTFWLAPADGGDATAAPLALRVAAASAARTASPALVATGAVGGGILLVAIAAGAATDMGRFGIGAAAAGLYTRLARVDVLKHEVRAGVHAYVAAHPGVRYEDLRRELGLSNGALAFHLRVLERERYVVTRAEWTRRRFYAAGEPPLVAAPDAATSVARAVTTAGAATPKDVADALGISRQLARYHLRALERAGRVLASGSGRTLRYRPAGGEDAPAGPSGERAYRP